MNDGFLCGIIYLSIGCYISDKLADDDLILKWIARLLWPLIIGFIPVTMAIDRAEKFVDERLDAREESYHPFENALPHSRDFSHGRLH